MANKKFTFPPAKGKGKVKATADEALKWALTGSLTAVEWDEVAEPLNPAPATVPPIDGTTVVSH